MSTNLISFTYTTPEFKYQKKLYILDDEICLLTQTTLKDLFEKNIKNGSDHVLALVHDEGKGQNIFDAKDLGIYLAKGERWKWKNPATNKTIQKIEYFVIKNQVDGYKLIKKIKTDKIGDVDAYNDFWLCNNLATANDPENPFAYESLRDLGRHYILKNDFKTAQDYNYQTFKSIEKHFGKGIALLLIPFIRSDVLKLPNVLFHTSQDKNLFKYKFLDDFFLNTPLEKFFIGNKDIFDFSLKAQHVYDTHQTKLTETLSAKNNDPITDFVICLNTIFNADSFEHKIFYPFLKHSNKDVVSLTQAILCVYCNEIKDEYIQNLRNSYPSWPLGKALEYQLSISKSDQIAFGNDAPLDKLIQLSSASNDPNLLKIVFKLYESYSIKSPTWGNITNLSMRMICISRFSLAAVEAFAENISASEEDNCLKLLKHNLTLIPSYKYRLPLSTYQMTIGIKNKDKNLYEEGIKNALYVFDNRTLHPFITTALGKILISEITPFKSNLEIESKGVKVLEYNLVATQNKNVLSKMYLVEWVIRKGTTIEAQKAYQWLQGLIKDYPKEPLLPYCSIRYALRFAKNEDDINQIETELAKIEKLDDKMPLFFLLKALWYSHPLKRKSPEWFVPASQNLIKAFKDADQSGVDFLIKNLHRFDKLSEEDATRCKADILYLLGLGDA